MNNMLYLIFYFKKLILYNDIIQKFDYNIDRKENELICFLCCNIFFCQFVVLLKEDYDDWKVVISKGVLSFFFRDNILSNLCYI